MSNSGLTHGLRPTANRWLLATLAVLVFAAGASAVDRASSRSHGAAPAAFVVALPAPSAGDVSYGIASVRIAPGGRSLPTPEPPRGQMVFSNRVGGLAIAARSPAWRALGATTRVYVVVAKLQGSDPQLRQVALFVVCRRPASRRSSAAGGAVTFSIANARAATGSFWVRGVDRRGYADIFHVHNMLATAVGNWSRYLSALHLASAMAAALHPSVQGPPAAEPARGLGGARRPPTIWTGGQHPSHRARAIFQLLLDALGNPSSYAAVKTNPLIAQFIADELHNPTLAARWRRVSAELPLQVPDAYAAAASEEARFTRVRAPRIARAHVGFSVSTNSSQLLGGPMSHGPKLDVAIDPATGGSVTGSSAGYGPNINCGNVCEWHFYQVVVNETLVAHPASGYAFTDWVGCDHAAGDTCTVTVGRGDKMVTANFTDLIGITVFKSGRGSGSVTSSPAGIDCGQRCSAAFLAHAVDLTARPDPGSTFGGWSGCDSVNSANLDCTVGFSYSRSPRAVTVTFNRSIRLISTVAGTGSPCTTVPSCGDGGTATTARLSEPAGVAVGGGEVMIADTGDNELRTISAADGTISRSAGTGTPCAAPPSCGDGAAATSAQLSQPRGVAVSSMYAYVADTGDDELRQLQLAPPGNIFRDAANTQLHAPEGVAADPNGNVYIADTGHNLVLKLAANGTITTIAGDGTPCTTPPNCGDGRFAPMAQLNAPAGVAVDTNGNVYIADSGDNEVRMITANGTITRIAGNGTPCTTPPDCADYFALTAQLNDPSGVAVDASGNVYIADSKDDEVRMVTPDGTITRIAGNGTACTAPPNCGDGGPATSAQLHQPTGIAIDNTTGDVYIADKNDDEVRKVG